MDSLSSSDEPWLDPDDPWYGRSYIGDEKRQPRTFKLAPQVAVFYGSDEDDEPDVFDLEK